MFARMLCLFIMLWANSIQAYTAAFFTKGLYKPWSMAFIDTHTFLLTERNGRLLKFSTKGGPPVVIQGTPQVLSEGQGGLLDVVLHPNFKSNHFVYLSYTAQDEQNLEQNTLYVMRAKLSDLHLKEKKILLKIAPSRSTKAHYAARMLFLQDGTLLISSGDAFTQKDKAQDLSNHLGKILRILDDGKIPSDNPFLSVQGAKPEIYALGSRNAQAMIQTPDGRVYMHEHGPKGGDELNLLLAGANYGWPLATYGINYTGELISPYTTYQGTEQPLKYWVPSIAPSAMLYYSGTKFPELSGKLLLTTLRNQDVRALTLQKNGIQDEQIILGGYGRMRFVGAAPDGGIWFLTDAGEVLQLERD